MIRVLTFKEHNGKMFTILMDNFLMSEVILEPVFANVDPDSDDVELVQHGVARIYFEGYVNNVQELVVREVTFTDYYRDIICQFM